LGDGTRILDIGRAEVLRSGKDLALLGIGATVYPALEAARLLENEGIECAVVNCRFVKPLDTATLGTVFKSTFEALTIEDNVLAGGFGSAVMEAAEQLGWGVRVHRLGYPDLFIEHATRSALLEKYGLTATGIARAARDALGSTAVSGWHTEHR
jgi:1-deoxy-D-xylulose-5-phosphate synthase